MITYTWSITRLDCLPEAPAGTNYVITAHWRLTGTDASYTGTVYGTCSFSVPSTDPFIPYDELTLAIVLGWIWNNGVDKESAEANVAQQIENQINPPIVSPPLPW